MVEIGCKYERETETKDTDNSWRRTAILTIFRAPLSASFASPREAIPSLAGGTQGGFCSDLTALWLIDSDWLLTDRLSVGTYVDEISKHLKIPVILPAVN